MKNLRFLFILLALVLGTQSAHAQCSILSTAVSQTPTILAGGYNSVAYNPVNGYYYTLTGNYIQTHNSSGTFLNSTYYPSLKSLWWNPNTAALEGNGYNTYGIYQLTLGTNGYPTAITILFSGSNHQPFYNSQGAYDANTNQIIYFYNSTFYRYSRSTGSLLGTTTASGIPVSASSLSLYNIVYMDCVGKELGVFDWITKRLYFFNKATGGYVGFSQLPISAPNPSSYGLSYTNDRLFVSNNVSFVAYKVINYGLETSSITGPYCDSSNVSVNFSINSLTFNTGNVFTAQLSNASGSFNSPTTIGTVTSTTSSTISGMIPANTPYGANYRIRVVSSNPVQVGSDNGLNITINVPTVNLGSAQSICPGDTAVLTAPSGVLSYNWSSGATSQVYNATTAGSYSVTVSNGICSKSDTIAVSLLSAPSPTLADTTTICGTSTVLNPGSFSAYSWNTGATSSTLTATNSGLYIVTVTGTNTCTATDQTFVNLLNPTINNGDTSICAGDTIELSTATGCYFSLSSITVNNSYQVGANSYTGDDRGGIAVTPTHVYLTGDSYTARYTTGLSSPTSLPRRDGIFSDLSSGDLYTFWSTTYNEFNASSSYINGINAIRTMDASLNYTGAAISLSQTINAGSASMVFAGSGYVILWSNYDNHFYKIELPTGTVTDVGMFELSGTYYPSESWAAWGVAECNGLGYSVVYRSNTNSTAGTNNTTLARFDISTNTFSLASTFTSASLGDMASLTYSPWNSRWYFHSEGSNFAGSNSENLGYADANHNGSGGSVAINNYSWSTGASTPTISLSPSSTSNYSVTVSHGSTSCSDTISVTVNATPTISLSDTSNFCNADSVQVSAPSGYTTYNWSNGASSASTYIDVMGFYSVSVTNANGCSNSDSTYVNLVDARIAQGDTTLCSADSVDLDVNNLCGFQIQSITLNNLNSAYDQHGGHTGGIAVTPNYIYSNGSSYCSRYNPTLNSYQNFATRDGIFSDLSTGQLYTFWNTTYNNFSYSSTYTQNISAIRKMDASLNYGTTIALSQTINASYNSVVAAGTGFVVLWSGYDQNFYKITLSTGNVEVIGNQNISNYFYFYNGWASYGVAECTDSGISIVAHATTNFGQGSYRSIGRYDINTGSWTEVAPTINVYSGMTDMTYSRWNNKWYFAHASSRPTLGQYSPSIGYADATSTNTGGGNSGNVLWSTSDTSASITVSPNTTTSYSVSVTNGSNSCSDTVNITVIQSPVVSDTTTDLTCFGASTGAASVSVSGGTTPYTYAWSNAATTSTLSNINAGTYAYTVTGGNNCTVIDSVDVTSPPEIISTATVNSSASCFATSNGSATVSVSGGVSPYTYLWPSGGTDTTNTMVSGGWNIVTITDANSCVVNDSVFMTSPVEIDSAGPITSTTTFFCPGTTGTLVAANYGTGVTTNTYSQTSTTLSPTPTNTSAMNFTFSSAPTTNISGATLNIYTRGDFDASSEYCYIYDENGSSIGNTYYPYYGNCNTYIMSTLTLTQTQLTSWLLDGSITFNATPRYTVSNYTSCPTEVYMELTYTYTSDINTYWFSAISTDTTQALGTGNTFAVSPQATTTYYAANFSNGCNSTFDSITVIVPPAPSTAYLLNPTTICPGETVSVNAYGASSYAWPTSDPTISGSGSTASVSPTTTTDYFVTITNAFNCSYVDTMTIPVLDAPSGTILSTSPVSCSNASNGQAIVYGTGGTSPYTYSWSNGASGAVQLGMSAGTYVVTISGANTCSDTLSVTVGGPIPIVFNETVTDALCNGANNGSIALATSGGSSPYTYVWSNAATTSGISNLSPGTYSVTVTDNGGCSNDTNFVITEPILLASAILTTSPETCPGLGNGSISATASGGTAPYAYTWNNGGMGVMLNNLNGGSYIVTVTDANGCTSTANGSVSTLPSSMNLAITNVNNNACYNGSTGSATASSTGGSSPYVYSWSNGSSTSALSSASAGTYYVTVTDNNSCQKTDSVTVTEPTQLMVTPTVYSNVTCNGATNGSASVAASGATPTYSYNWPGGATTFTNASLSAGTFVVTVTDANSCTETTSIVITEPTALSISATVVDVSCNGLNDGSISTAIAGGTPTYTYVWSNTATTSTVSGLAPGTYTVTITDGNACTNNSTFTIAQPVGLTASIAMSTDIACKNDASGSAMSAATGGSTPYAYAWSNNTSNAAVTNLTAGTYIVTVTDNNGCFDTSSVTLTEPSTVLAIAITDSVQILCNGLTTGSATTLASGGGLPYIYSWSNGSSNTIISSLTAGVYTASVTDAFGCTVSTSTNITEPQALSMVLTSLTNVSCNGLSDGSAAMSVTGGTTPYAFNWSNGDTTSTLNNVTQGSYGVTVTDANGCSSTASITINEPVALSATISNSQNVACSGAATGFAVAQGTGGTLPYNYLWTTGSTADSIYSQLSGFYTVTITDANGCIDSALANLIQPSSLNLSVASSINNNCFGESIGSAQLAVVGGSTPYVYAWPNGAGTNTQSLMSAGTYVVTVTDNNSCQDTTLVTISEPTDAVISITNQQNAQCFDDQNGAVSISVSGAIAPYTYAWNTGSTSTSLTGLPAGTYTVSVTDGNSCLDTLQVQITEPLAITSALTPVDALCNADTNGQITSVVSGGTSPYSYIWSNGDTVADGLNLGANMYTVTISDANGCMDTLQATVNEPVALDLLVQASTDVNCFGDLTGTATMTTTGGTTPYVYNWSAGQSTATPSTLPTGLNSVTVTDANGCIDTNSVTLNTLSNIDVTLSSASDILCNGDTTSTIVVAANGGQGAYAYSWSVPGSDSTLTNQAAGVYYAYATDALGCMDTLLVTVTEPALIAGSIVNQLDPLCYGDSTGTVEISAAGGSGALSYAWASGNTSTTETNLPAGTHTVVITDTNSCVVNYDVIIGQPLALVNNGFTTTNISCFFDVNGSASVNMAGGISPYTYAWANGQTNVMAIGLSGGNYPVLITDANGCMFMDTATVVSTNPLTPSNLPADTLGCGTSVVLQANTAFVNYTWSNSSSTSSMLTVTSSATITFIGLDANNCNTYDTVDVSLFPAATVSLGADVYNKCEGTLHTIDAGNGFATYVWSNGDTTSTSIVTTSGNYVVTITDNNGCQASDDVDVFMWALPVVNLGPDTVICDPLGTASITLNAGAGLKDYDWSTGGSDSTLTVTSAGTYSVTVQNNNGCYGSDTITIEFDPCLGINDVTSDLTIKIYPNPTRGWVNVDLNGYMGENIEINVLTTNGQLMFNKTIMSNNQSELHTQLDLNHLAQGLYLIKIKSGDEVKIERISIY